MSGLEHTDLHGRVDAGQTLAQIAGATSGESADGLVAALVAAEKTEFAAKVTAGKITQAHGRRDHPDAHGGVHGVREGHRRSAQRGRRRTATAATSAVTPKDATQMRPGKNRAERLRL
jgi:hypothetical protein